MDLSTFPRRWYVHSVIFSIYNCCKTPSNKHAKKRAHNQQELMLFDLNWTGTPRKFFKQDLVSDITQLQNKYGSFLQVWILWDCNEYFHNSLIATNICKEFGLFNIFDEIHPTLNNFKTYIKGYRVIDYALGPAQSVRLWKESKSPTTVYYEAFFHW